MKWSEARIDGVIRIDQVAALFEVWTSEKLPFAKFKVKILERAGSDFLGVPNVAVRNRETGTPEYVSGLGKTVEDALFDTVNYLIREVENNVAEHAFMETDFVWSSPEDF